MKPAFEESISAMRDYVTSVQSAIELASVDAALSRDHLLTATLAYVRSSQLLNNTHIQLDVLTHGLLNKSVEDARRRSLIVWGGGLVLIFGLFAVSRRMAVSLGDDIQQITNRLDGLRRDAAADLGDDPGFVDVSGDELCKITAATEAFQESLLRLRDAKHEVEHHYADLLRETHLREEAEAERGASERRFEAVLRHANIGIYVHRHLKPLFVNPAMLKLIGMESEQEFLALESTLSFVANEFREQVRGHHEARLRGEPAPESYVVRLLAQDGTERWVANRSFPFDVGGKTAVCTMLVDITERRRVEMELRKLTRALEQSPNLVFITDVGGVIEYVNEAFVTATGYSRTEAIGRTPKIIAHPDTPHETHRDLWATILSGREWRAEVQDRRKDGSAFWVVASISPIRDEDGNLRHFVAMHQDITEIKRVQMALIQAKEDADVANRTKSEILANMSHELRTPLNAIIGFSEAMRYAIFGPISDHYKRYAEDIHQSGTHLLSLINDILDVSAIESGNLRLFPESIIVSDLVETAVRFVEKRAEQAGLAVIVDLPHNMPRLKCDERRIKQVLLNLLSNAVKFTPRDGSITISGGLERDGSFALCVSDTGIGMDEAGIAKAMEPFGQVDSSLARRHEGTGLGLPLSKSLIEAHGARFEITSRLGAGTQVKLIFPANMLTHMDSLLLVDSVTSASL